MSNPRKELSYLLSFWNVALTNGISHEGLATRLSKYGYSREKIEEGLALYKKATKLTFLHTSVQGQKLGATDDFHKAREAAHEAYIRYSKIGRIAIKDNRRILTELGLSTSYNKTFSGWSEKVNQFYNELLKNNEALDAIGEFGITREKLLEGKSLYEKTIEAKLYREEVKGKQLEVSLRKKIAL